MKTLKGAKALTKIRGQVTQMMEGLEGPAPKLAIVRMGEKPDDIFYERGVAKKMENLGLRARAYVFPEQISDSDFKAESSVINCDPDMSGILLLCPLSKQTVETDIEKMIGLEKDLDGILLTNITRVLAGDKTGFAPCTTEAVTEVLKANEIDMTGKNVTIAGHSMAVGRPLFMLMLEEDAAAIIRHTRTRDLKAECRRAEALVAATGKTKMLDGRHVGQDAIVIDMGINVDENGKICGDADFQSTESMASMATPVLGGVGAMIMAVLTKHLVLTGQRQKRN